MGERNPAVDRYLHYLPAAHRHALQTIRVLIHQVQPLVREVMRYGMPLFDYHGLLCGFLSTPQGISLYGRAEIVERYRTQLGSLDVRRGRLRFQHLEEVPLNVLRNILIDSCATFDREVSARNAHQKAAAMSTDTENTGTVSTGTTPTDPEAAPTLHYQGRQLITAPTHFGPLRDSRELVGHPAALRARMAEDGYLYLPAMLDPARVAAARDSILAKLEAEGALHPDYPRAAGVIASGVHFTFRPDLANGNAAVEQLLYTGVIMEFMQEFLGGPVLHYDFTWLRAKAPGPNTATSPHCDIVFMSRGTKQLYTVWTPLSDISYDLGGLIVLENSHRRQDHLQEYWEFDVDTYCVNDTQDEAHERWAWGKGGGAYSKDAIGVRQELGGRWLSAEYKAGDLLIFGMFTLHASLDNRTNRVRLSTDSRYQLAGEAVDERWIGAMPIAHGPDAKVGMIC